MFSSLRRHFGSAGLIISVIALIAALAGGAIAASGGAAGSSAKVKKVKGPRGPKGAMGATGATGPAGAPGKDGAPGVPGAPGKDGVSVTGEELEPHEEGCEAGGVLYTSASGDNAVCNGEEGSPWTAGGTLPASQTETGTWSVATPGAFGFIFSNVSFPIPLPAVLSAANAHTVTVEEVTKREEGKTEGEGAAPGVCPGDAGKPQAKPGELCVYIKLLAGTEAANPVDISRLSDGQEGADPSGAVLIFHAASPGGAVVGDGSFAVTAPVGP
jgi:hypothetical protein